MDRPALHASARARRGLLSSATLKVFVNTDDVDALHRQLSERPNPSMRPGAEVPPWNAKVMDVIAQVGNRLSFKQPIGNL